MSDELTQSASIDTQATAAPAVTHESASTERSYSTESYTEHSEPETSTASDAPSEPTDAKEPEVDNAEAAKQRIERKKARQNQRELEAERAARAAAQAEIEALRQQTQHLQQQFAPQQEQIPQQPVPIIDPFTGQYMQPNDPRYGAALYQQQQQKWSEQQIAMQRQQEFARQQQELDTQFLDALDDASDRYPDFEEVVIKNKETPFTEHMVNAAKILGPESADVLYYMAKNPKEVQRISKLNPFQQQQELAKHAFAYAANRNVMSKAPAPIQPVGETSGVKRTKTLSEMSYEEVKQADRERRRRGR